jgi:ABC-type Fe3+-citrate transport system substrate-binding protein
LSNTTAVAKAVAKEAETRARVAINEVLAAHAEVVAADAAAVQARDRRAAAGPALSRAVDAALAVGITDDQLAALGITVPAARTRRRAAAKSAGSSTVGTHTTSPMDSGDSQPSPDAHA